MTRLCALLASAVIAAGCATASPSPPAQRASASSSPSAAPSTAVPSTATAPATPGARSTSPVTTPVPSNPAAFVEGEPYAPPIEPSDFVAVVDNTYLPWTPGTTWVFHGGEERNVVSVLGRTKTILGVVTIVVHDQVFTAGALTEDTFDWYAQDRAGNVWYFGEDTKELDEGKVTSTKGSWEAGVDGAQPGIVMLGQPTVGETYRQEFLAGEAEDVAKVLMIGGSVDVHAGTFRRVIVPQDWSRLDPGVIEHKTYAPGVGVVLERLAKGGHEVVELMGVSRG